MSVTLNFTVDGRVARIDTIQHSVDASGNGLLELGLTAPDEIQPVNVNAAPGDPNAPPAPAPSTATSPAVVEPATVGEPAVGEPAVTPPGTAAAPVTTEPTPPSTAAEPGEF